MNFGRRPNRGGGKFNKPRGSGGGGSRKASGKTWDDGDDFSFTPKPTLPTRFRSRGRGRAGAGSRAGSRAGARGGVGNRGGARGGVGSKAGTGSRAGAESRKYPDDLFKEQSEFNLFGNLIETQSKSNNNSQKGGRFKSKSEHRVHLQTINMTTENQKDVKQLLRELQNHEKEAPAE